MSETEQQITNPILRVRGLTKWYGMTCALRDFDIDVDRGEIVALLGPNGAGKSTFVKIISGYIRPDAGRIWLDGKEVQFKSPQDAILHGIGVVYQELAIVKDLKVSYNIFLGREPVKNIFKFIKPIDFEVMYETSKNILDGLGLHIPLDQEAQYCSGGEKQGIAIARCILSGAKLVILDEPYSALSVKGRRKVNELVLKLKEKNISSIIISHDIHQVYEIADRYVIISRGQKVAEYKKGERSLEEIEEAIAIAT
jgi:ABC-type sugar transport system ATPase subunit